MDKNNTFEFYYSASQQDEIQEIRKKYIQDAESTEIDKMEQLRRLDYSVTQKASTKALIVGIISALIMGIGMSLTMTDLGNRLNMPLAYVIGIAIGIVGMIGVIYAYPLYKKTLKKQREKIAPQILKLTDELADK